MRFRIVRLTTIRNGSKQTISTSGVLQMILEPNTRQCVNEDFGLPSEVNCEIPHGLESRRV